ncbi:TIGR01244 family phosphatase [Erythrobacter arachoides]|uniref:TIGR01244 family phosphatase n=1 Tax=Aurantiacibacter arachoides TaxID=1850444 RepID=A0A845A1Q7_9SPHN|nr:TIGR01244 family sulfur transferase [Aurantiacibacter arachoides]MXO93858.1 TIGR01244 family phosphatase [Aurantiacibacter arachoides]GGD46170.1 hypothetical protein GCM10011411_02230 [Aurantiacibacter arachoides]
MTNPKPLSDRLSVTPQIDPAAMQALADAGYRAIISNRPDGEEPGQPDWATIERAARDAGMEACHIPVAPGALTDDKVAEFGDALHQLPAPIVGFCRTGMRAASLWALSNPDEQSPETLIATAAEAGYDLSALRHRLAKA